MSINIQNKNIQKIYKGSQSIKKVYAGSVRVFPDAIGKFIENCEALGGDAVAIRTLYDNIDVDVRFKADILLFPSVIDTGVVYGMDNMTGDLIPFIFSRASEATLFNKDLNMQLVESDMPRVDYANYSKEAKILVEKENTNLAIYSNLYINPPDAIVASGYTIESDTWLNKLSGISKSAVLAKINGTNYFYRSKITKLKDHRYAQSSFFRTEGYDPAIIGDNWYPTNGDTNFVFPQSLNASYTKNSTTIDLGGGIYRHGYSNISTVNHDNSTVGFAKNTISLNRKFYYSGLQIEMGSIITSYIPTKDVATTRSADILNINLLQNCRVYIKTTKEEKYLDKLAGVWNVQDDITESDGILYLAVLNR